MLKTKLRTMGNFGPEINWLHDETLEQAWKNSKNPDWLLWMAGIAKVDLKLIVKAKVAIVNYCRSHIENEISLQSLKVADKFSKGKATIGEFKFASEMAFLALNEATGPNDYAEAAVATACRPTFHTVAYDVSFCLNYGTGKFDIEDFCEVVRDIIKLEDVEKNFS